MLERITPEEELPVEELKEEALNEVSGGFIRSYVGGGVGGGIGVATGASVGGSHDGHSGALGASGPEWRGDYGHAAVAGVGIHRQMTTTSNPSTQSITLKNGKHII